MPNRRPESARGNEVHSPTVDTLGSNLVIPLIAVPTLCEFEQQHTGEGSRTTQRIRSAHANVRRHSPIYAAGNVYVAVIHCCCMITHSSKSCGHRIVALCTDNTAGHNAGCTESPHAGDTISCVWRGSSDNVDVVINHADRTPRKEGLRKENMPQQTKSAAIDSKKQLPFVQRKCIPPPRTRAFANRRCLV
jgi:hypothetical protein